MEEQRCGEADKHIEEQKHEKPRNAGGVQRVQKARKDSLSQYHQRSVALLTHDFIAGTLVSDICPVDKRWHDAFVFFVSHDICDDSLQQPQKVNPSSGLKPIGTDAFQHPSSVPSAVGQCELQLTVLLPLWVPIYTYTWPSHSHT